jgi:predicted metal-dependent hydrolase
VTHKSSRIAAMIEHLRGGALDARYLGYFECFNQQLFYEAHDVLEDLWLEERRQPNDLFYKGLIQLAGAFVHLQKNRLRPALALFRLAEGNLGRYTPRHEHLDTAGLLELIRSWEIDLEEREFQSNPLNHRAPPCLRLIDSCGGGA